MDAKFIRQEQAAKVSQKADNLITRQLVEMAMVQALLTTPRETQEWIVADFDLKYFAEVMLNLFSEKNHKTIQAIFNGEDLRGWDDEDFK
jgi:hypothetical protein